MFNSKSSNNSCVGTIATLLENKNRTGLSNHCRERVTKAIGGFFELELVKGNNTFHKNAIALSTGRACISFMIEQLKPAKIFLPFYTCDATVEPFKKYGVPFEYYAINKELFPLHLPKLKKQEFFLYTNYFGLKGDSVKQLRKLYNEQLIIDNTHAFFLKGYKHNWSFNSVRKYFGVPDGAYLYAPVELKRLTTYPRFNGISIAHSLNRHLGNIETGYQQYVAYEQSLNSDIYTISFYSETVLSQINYDEVIKKRRDNFFYLHKELQSCNRLQFAIDAESVPFCYPFLPEKSINKSILHKNNFFIPSYWTDTLNRNINGFEKEKMLSKELLALPTDHRYSIQDMKAMLTFIKKLIDGK